mmetsp:Transcript_22953/g.53579  ORF Transcript_22953/g.53579 Transcript_22953/m.53579 type:complete len:702 (-) Transcript_22953:470-2575(-)
MHLDKETLSVEEEYEKLLKPKALTEKDKGKLLQSIADNRRADLRVCMTSNTNIARLQYRSYINDDQVAQMFELVANLKSQRRKQKLNMLFVNATELGGGVAEMRPDTTQLLRDLGVQADWVVIDGAPMFYDVTVHVHEGIQNPKYRPIGQREAEILQINSIANFVRMRSERVLDAVDIIWIDDPQPLGLIPLIRALYPNVTIVWRCHVHADPTPSVGNLIRDWVQGNLDSERDSILLQFLQAETAGAYKAIPLRADLAVFHMEQFALGLGLTTVPVYTMGPAVNPLAFKNMPLDEDVVSTTLEKLGVKSQDEDIPPYILEVSRFDPYKGPIEAITAFVNMMKRITDSVLQTKGRFVFAASIPGDNPSGIRLCRLIRSYVQALPVSEFPPWMQGKHDIRNRIHLLELADKSREEIIVERINKLQRFNPDAIKAVRAEVMEMRGQPIEEIMASLHDVGFVSQQTVDAVNAQAAELQPVLDTAVSLTPGQRTSLYKCIASLHRTKVTMRHTREGSLTGRQMNHAEVNALQTGARVRLQFSSKEGFGLTVAEAMIKHMPSIPGVLVATLVGGVKAQLNPDVGLPVEYHPDDIAASLNMYINLPDEPDEKYLQELYHSVSHRETVCKVSDALHDGFTMPKEERAVLNDKAQSYILSRFATHSNVRNILQAVTLCGTHTPSQPATLQSCSQPAIPQSTLKPTSLQSG